MGKFIKVKVFPGSKRIKIIKKSEDSFEIEVREKAEKGLANKAVIRVLSVYLKISEPKIRLISGSKTRNKIFIISETQTEDKTFL